MANFLLSRSENAETRHKPAYKHLHTARFFFLLVCLFASFALRPLATQRGAASRRIVKQTCAVDQMSIATPMLSSDFTTGTTRSPAKNGAHFTMAISINKRRGTCAIGDTRQSSDPIIRWTAANKVCDKADAKNCGASNKRDKLACKRERQQSKFALIMAFFSASHRLNTRKI